MSLLRAQFKQNQTNKNPRLAVVILIFLLTCGISRIAVLLRVSRTVSLILSMEGNGHRYLFQDNGFNSPCSFSLLQQTQKLWMSRKCSMTRSPCLPGSGEQTFPPICSEHMEQLRYKRLFFPASVMA